MRRFVCLIAGVAVSASPALSSGFPRGAVSILPLFVILMAMKKASNLLLQLSCVTRLTHGNCVVKKVPLDRSVQCIITVAPRHRKTCSSSSAMAALLCWLFSDFGCEAPPSSSGQGYCHLLGTLLGRSWLLLIYKI